METFAKNDNRITNIIFGFTKLLKQNLRHFWNVCTIWMLFTCLSVQIVQSKFILFDITVSPFQTSVAFYRETSHLLCIANQRTRFCMKCNTRLEWIKEPLNKFLMMLLISSKNSALLLRSWPHVIYSNTWGFEFDICVFVRRVC